MELSTKDFNEGLVPKLLYHGTNMNEVGIIFYLNIMSKSIRSNLLFLQIIT